MDTKSRTTRAARATRVTVMAVMALLAACGGGGGESSTPAPAPVTPAPAAVTISGQPASQEVVRTAPATFTVTASGVPLPTYQWQVSNDGGLAYTNIPGATAATLSLPAVAEADTTKQFRAIVSNSSGSVNSASAMLTVTRSGTAVLSSVTTVVQPVLAVVDGNTTVDLTSEPTLVGQRVTLQRIVAPELDDTAAGGAAGLNATFSPGATLRLVLPAAPRGDGITVNVKVGTTYAALAAMKAPVLYYHSSPGDAPDGEGEFVPVQSTLIGEPEATLTARIPAIAFAHDPALGHVAQMKIGVAQLFAQAFTEPPRSAPLGTRKAKLSMTGTATTPHIPCPLHRVGCAETSAFNLQRRFADLKGAVYASAHRGVDWRAAVGEPVTPPRGGKLIEGMTRAYYDAAFTRYKARIAAACTLANGCAEELTECKFSRSDGNLFKGGVRATLFFEAGGFAIKYLHLSEFESGSDAPVLSTLDTRMNFDGYASDGVKPMGKTGATGTACGQPHLHMTLMTASTPVVRNGSVGWALGPETDPFPHAVSTLEVTGLPQPADLPLVSNRQHKIKLLARDEGQRLISSDVGRAEEWTGDGRLFDPKRKVCAAALPSAALKPRASGSVSYPGYLGELCVPWGEEITVDEVSTGPSTDLVLRFMDIVRPGATVLPLSALEDRTTFPATYVFIDSVSSTLAMGVRPNSVEPWYLVTVRGRARMSENAGYLQVSANPNNGYAPDLPITHFCPGWSGGYTEVAPANPGLSIQYCGRAAGDPEWTTFRTTFYLLESLLNSKPEIYAGRIFYPGYCNTVPGPVECDPRRTYWRGP